MFYKMFSFDGTIIDREITEKISRIMIRTKVIFEEQERYFYAGEDGYNNYPVWTQYGHKLFDTEDEAIEFAKHLGKEGWHWKIIPDTVELINLEVEVHMKITEYDRIVKKVTL